MSKPKSCGFCSNQKPWLRSTAFDHLLWFVECSCGHRGPLCFSEEQAIKNWNRVFVRADDAVVEYMVERQEVDYRTDKGA